jgi:hypothetical protein
MSNYDTALNTLPGRLGLYTGVIELNPRLLGLHGTQFEYAHGGLIQMRH